MALQIRRGTNAERLGITLVEGEVVYVTDFQLATIEVTSIDATTNVLTTTLDHGLAVNDQILFQSDTSNGLTQGTVYYVKTAPTNVTFTLSTTQGGTTLDITGTAASLVFAVGPTNELGVPYGYTISALYVGDGVTAGGNPAGSSVLDDLYDVEIGTYGGVGQYGQALADGQMLVYNADTSRWENNNEVSVTDLTRTAQFTHKGAFSGDSAVILSPALRVKKELTDATSGTGHGGPAILFQTDGTTTEKSIVQLGAYNNSSGNHDFVVKISNDDFSTSNSVILSGPTRTNINEGVLYVDKTNGRIGVNNTTPAYSADITGTVHSTGAATFDSTVYSGSTLTVNNGTIVSNSATGTVMNTTATTVNAFGAGTAVTLGATTGTLTLRNPTIVGSQTTQNLFNTTATTLNIGGASTTTAIGSTSSGTTTVGYDLTVGNDLRINGNDIKSSSGSIAITLSGTDVAVAGDLTVTGNDIKSSGGTTAITFSGADVTVAGDLQVSGNDIKSSSGSTAITLSGTDVTVAGNLTVNGTTTTVNSTTLTVDDKNIELGSVATPTDTTANGGGITLKGATDKTIIWSQSSDKWNLSNGLYVDGQIVNSAHDVYFGSGTFANSTNYALVANGTTGNVGVGNDLYVYGDMLKLNTGGTGVDCSIVVERGAVDATILWSEASNTWIISNNMVTDGYIGTNGYDFHFNNDDGTIDANALVNLNVKRGAGSDVRIRWNEALGRWQSTTDGSTYIALPNQALDTTSNPTFAGVTAGNVTVGVANDQTITTTAGNLTISSNGGTTTISDIISHTGASATFNNNVTLGSSSADTLTVDATPTFNSGATINSGLGVNGTTTLYDSVNIGSSSGDTLAITALVSGNITFTDNGTTTNRGVRGSIGSNDYWKIGGAATGTNAGYLEIATGDDATEPIYVRQYSGGSTTSQGTVTNEIQLLDQYGITQLGDTTITGDLNSSNLETYNVNLISGSSYGNAYKTVEARTINTTGAGAQVIPGFSTSIYRTAKLLLQYRKGTDFQCCELLVMHDGTTAYYTVSNEIIIGTAIATAFDATITAGNLYITATLVSGTKYMLADYTLLGAY